METAISEAIEQLKPEDKVDNAVIICETERIVEETAMIKAEGEKAKAEGEKAKAEGEKAKAEGEELSLRAKMIEEHLSASRELQ